MSNHDLQFINHLLSLPNQMTTNTDTCPHCGAELKEWFGIGKPIYACGIGNIRTDLCRERESHAKTREELERVKTMLKDSGKTCDAFYAPTVERMQKAEELLRQINAFVEALNTSTK